MPMRTCEGLAERSGPGGCAVTVPAGYVADRGVMLAMIVASMPWFGPTKYKKYQQKKSACVSAELLPSAQLPPLCWPQRQHEIVLRG